MIFFFCAVREIELSFQSKFNEQFEMFKKLTNFLKWQLIVH